MAIKLSSRLSSLFSGSRFGRILVYGAVVLVIVTVLFIGFSYITEKSATIHDVRITNVTATGATVTWITDTPVRGSVIYSRENSWNFLFSYMGKMRAYDDRDIEEVEYAVYALERWEKYYVHHVTLHNLKPDSKYYYRVSTGFKSVEYDYPAIETLSEIDVPYTPDPVYGMVLDSRDNTNKPTDGIVYYRLENDQDSMWYSQVLNNEGRWSGDLGGVTLYSGEGFNRNSDGIKINVEIKTSIGNGEYEFPLTDYQPLPYTYVNVIKGDESGIKPLYQPQSIPDVNSSVFNQSLLAAASAQTKCGGFANPGEYHCNTTECLDYLCLSDGSWQATGSRGMCNLHPDCASTPSPDDPKRCGGFANPGEWLCNTIDHECMQYQCDPGGSGNWSGPSGTGVCAQHPDCKASPPPTPPVDEDDIPPGEDDPVTTPEDLPGTCGFEWRFEVSTGLSTVSTAYFVLNNLAPGQYEKIDNTARVECTIECGADLTYRLVPGSCRDRRDDISCGPETITLPSTLTTTGSEETFDISDTKDYGEKVVDVVSRSYRAKCDFLCTSSSAYAVDFCARYNPPPSNPCPSGYPDVCCTSQCWNGIWNFGVAGSASWCECCQADCGGLRGSCESQGYNSFCGGTPAVQQCTPQQVTVATYYGDKNFNLTSAQNVGSTLPEVWSTDSTIRCDFPCLDSGWQTTGLNCAVSGDVEYPAESSRLTQSVMSSVYATGEDSSITINDSGVYELDGVNLTDGGESIEVVVPDDRESVNVRFYRDSNKNGKRDTGEEYITSKNIQVRKTADILSWDLQYGWNLISFPLVLDEAKTAKGLLEKIAQDGGYATHVAAYQNGQWSLYSKRGDWEFSNDFNIPPGAGYFVKVHKTTILHLKGNKLEESLPLGLANGWNLVGIIAPEKEYSADSLLTAITDNQIGADTVTRWQGGRYENFIKAEGIAYGNDYRLFDQGGYFIRVKSGAKVFTP